MEQEEIKIGDKIYVTEYSFISCVDTVKRLTKTMIIGERYRYDYPEGGYCCIKDNFSSKAGHLETPELKKKWEDSILLNWWHVTKDRLSIEQIKKIKEHL